MPTVAPVLRPATPADAEAGARCHAACWREAYAAIVDPVVLRRSTDDLEGRTERWREQLRCGVDDRWIAERGGEVVGFSSAGPGRDDDLPGRELFACYVRAAEWGTGLGARLLEAVVGDGPAYLWVFQANSRARAFYRKHGFVEDGTVKDEPRFERPEIRMVRGG